MHVVPLSQQSREEEGLGGGRASRMAKEIE
jgi:hypothetical protein